MATNVSNIEYQTPSRVLYDFRRVFGVEYTNPGNQTIDHTPPTIGNFVPAPGTPVPTFGLIQFDVTDNLSLLRRVVIGAEFPNGQWDFVHDGDNFSPKYVGSTRTGIASGFRFQVVPITGWLLSPTFRIIAYDTTGNEAT
jgi:hypothetical protein